MRFLNFGPQKTCHVNETNFISKNFIAEQNVTNVLYVPLRGSMMHKEKSVQLASQHNNDWLKKGLAFKMGRSVEFKILFINFKPQILLGETDCLKQTTPK